MMKEVALVRALFRNKPPLRIFLASELKLRELVYADDDSAGKLDKTGNAYQSISFTQKNLNGEGKMKKYSVLALVAVAPFLAPKRPLFVDASFGETSIAQ